MYNMYVNYQIRLTVELLKPPFETMCRMYREVGIDSDADCVQQCIRKRTMERYHMIPFGVIVNDTLKGEEEGVKMMSYNNVVANQLFGRQQLEISEDCTSHVCKRRDCQVRTAITSTTELMDMDVRVIGLRLNVPSDPSILVTTSPTLNLVEFLTYAMSCVSTWTGLSIISLEPVSLYRQAKQRIREHKQTKSDRRRHDHPAGGRFAASGCHEERSEIRKNTLGNISMMCHMSSLSRRILRLEEHYNINR